MKTILLCGGRGTRLAEETHIRPKPMVEIGGRPILHHIMNWYGKNGFNDFVCALGYKGEYIKEYFLNYQTLNSDFEINLGNGDINLLKNNQEDWKVSLIDTGMDTLTGGRLLRLKEHLKGEETFMLTYGDGVSNINIQELVKFHKSHGKIATVSAVRPPSRFGELKMTEDNQVEEFSEKPQTGEGWINGGFFVFNKEIFNYLEDDMTILERSPLEKVANENQLVAYKHEGFWQCMDTIRDKLYLNGLIESGDAPWLN